MAARENQGLQIALIIFVMLTIILIVTTFMFFNYYKTELEKNKGLMTENSQKDKLARDAKTDSDACKTLIGAAETDKVDAIQTAAKKDIETYGKTVPEGKQNYRYLVEFLGTELKNANARIADISAHEKELDEKIKADEAAKVGEIAEYNKKLTDTAKDLETEHAKFSHDRKEITASKDSLEKRFDTKRKEHEVLTKESGEKIATLSAENEKKDTLLRAINDKKREQDKANEVADGKITWVDQRSRTVWVNLGSGDGLRRQTSFSVFDQDDSNPTEASKKGKIEVTRLMERHLAEARIVDDNLSNPLMPGDNIFSPSWEAGRAEHFSRWPA